MSALPSTGVVQATKDAAVWLRPGLAEEYSVSSEGVRQDFVVAARPSGAGELAVELEVAGATAQEAAYGATLTLDATGRALAYHRLRVSDATGRELAARLEVPATDRLRVVVQDAGAVYPVRIDPTFSDADWVSLNPGIPGANATVYAMVADGSGNLYVGGDFTTAGGTSANNIAKWNGSAWSALGTGMNNYVGALAADSAGHLYLGGAFTFAGTTLSPFIAQANLLGAAPPTVTAISPTSGTTAGGTSVTITGTDFTGASAVTIGGVAATIGTITATTITATTGAHAAGVVNVAVTTPGGTGTGLNLYTYVAAPTGLVIVSDSFNRANQVLQGTLPAICLISPVPVYATAGASGNFWQNVAISGNRVYLDTDVGLSVAISSSGLYTKPSVLRLSATLNLGTISDFGDAQARGLALGYYTGSGASGNSYSNGARGLVLELSGKITLTQTTGLDSGLSIPYASALFAGAPFDPGASHTLSYQINTLTGDVFDVRLDGVLVGSFTAAGFTDANTPRAGFWVSSQAGGGSGFVDDFLVEGFTAPEIAVFDGIAPPANERTDNTGTFGFGSVNTGSSSAAQTFTIQNIGSATADLTGLVVTSTNATEFTFTAPLVATLAPGATTTFTVTFSPSAAGARSGVINIANNDADENPFEINVGGTGTTPAPVVTTLSYTGAVQTFTVPAGVTSITIDASGAQGGGSSGGTAGGLGARMQGTYSVTPGQVLSVVVGQQGLLQVGGNAQNSSGGGGGSFVYDNAGPTLLVAAGGGGGKCNFGGSVPLHAAAAGQITTSGGASSNGNPGGTGGNGGPAGLFSGTPCSGGGAGWLTGGGGPYGGRSYSLWTGGPGFSGGGGGGTGGVGGFGGGGGGGNHYGGGGGGGGFSGGGGGTDPTHGGGGGSYSIGTAQANLAGYKTGNGQVIITYTAGATTPEIAIEQPVGTNRVDGAASVAFGTKDVAETSSLTFTVNNTGSGALTLGAITFDGTNPGDFTVTTAPGLSTLPATTGTTTFVVTFMPLQSGARSAVMHIVNDDADENPFDIMVTGTGTNIIGSDFVGTTPVITIPPSGSFVATGLNFDTDLGFIPTPGTTYLFIDIQGVPPAGIIGFFNDLPQGGVVAMSFNGVIYYFQANYTGGVGNNDLTLTSLLSPGPSEWKWTAGPQARNAAAIFGTEDVGADANNPGARQGAMNWRTPNGNLWMFGGYGYATTLTRKPNYLNDLWEYNRTTGQWIWHSGAQIQNQFGTYAPADPALATPGSRHTGTTWTDSSGDLWLFGGFGYGASGGRGRLNDLWRFSPGTGLWTWMKGSDTPGALGVYSGAAGTLTPGARQGATGWATPGGNLYLFGGATDGVTTFHNDLWLYNTGTGNWTLVKGDGTTNLNGSYGTQGTPGAGNIPGARRIASGWVAKDGNLWLFGGQGKGKTTATTGDLNDLWRFDIALNQWEWVRGSDEIDSPGSYGVKGTEAPGNDPPARGAGGAWTTVDGKMWLIGGMKNLNSGPLHNDIWVFNPSTERWTWQLGSSSLNATGTYGTLGVAAPGNEPGARFTPSTWVTLNGAIWIFGGGGFDGFGNGGRLSDLWRYGIATPAGAPPEPAPEPFPDELIVNDAPNTSDAAAGTMAYVPVTGQLTGSDADGDKILFGSVSPTTLSQGTLSLNPDGTWSYTPAAGFVGQSTF